MFRKFLSVLSASLLRHINPKFPTGSCLATRSFHSLCLLIIGVNCRTDPYKSKFPSKYFTD